MPPALKRARTKSTTPSTTVSRAVQQAIATLASSSANLDPALFSQLLGSLHDAHAMALEQEGVVPKVEAREDEEGPRAIASPRVSPQPQPQAEEHSSSFSGRWWTRTVQFDDKTDEVVKRVLEDVEAALPKLDELGILLRPCCVEGKIDLMIWEFAIPGKAKTAWSGSLIKGTLAFPSDYPNTPPKAKTVPPLCHPNVYPSGTISACFEIGDGGFALPEASVPYEGTLSKGARIEAYHRAFSTFQRERRIALFLYGCQRIIHFPEIEAPAQLDAHQLAKKDPDAYSARIEEEVKNRAPTHRDLLDLADAQKRVESRRGRQK